LASRRSLFFPTPILHFINRFLSFFAMFIAKKENILKKNKKILFMLKSSTPDTKIQTTPFWVLIFKPI